MAELVRSWEKKPKSDDPCMRIVSLVDHCTNVTGELKMIASANRDRHTYAPDTLTLIEQGFEVYVDPWFYFAMSEGTPDDAQTAIAVALAAALETEEVKTAVFNALSTDVVNLGVDGTKQMLVDGVENTKVLFGK